MTAMFEVVDDLAPVIARQMHVRDPSLGSLDDATAVQATTWSVLGKHVRAAVASSAPVCETPRA